MVIGPDTADDRAVTMCDAAQGGATRPSDADAGAPVPVGGE
jgi:hypothetical protein